MDGWIKMDGWMIKMDGMDKNGWMDGWIKMDGWMDKNGWMGWIKMDGR